MKAAGPSETTVTTYKLA